ncbi:MAG: hypothetical protein IN808_02960 [Rubrobacter sp.]|nr:hypothetical protein [Rubrobacter sp.]
MPVKKKLTFVYALSGLLVLLLLLASIIGLLYGGGGFYDSYPASLAGLVGQDAVTLVVGVPLLVASMWLTARGSMSGLLLWGGALFYFAYSYYFYVIGGFNALFLVYIAIVSTSFYGLLSLLFAVDPEALRDRFGTRTPTHLAGGFLILISLLFTLMWGGMIISSAVAGTQPDEVLREVVIIDCTLLLPLLFFGGLLLWRRRPWGYVLGGILLVKALATGFTLAFTTALGAWWAWGIDPFDAFLFVLFAIMATGSLVLLVAYLRSTEEGG